MNRLKNSGYTVDRLFSNYSNIDARKWSIIINPGVNSIFCTCYTNNGETKGIKLTSNSYFELYDGNQFIPNRLVLDTNSFEVLATTLYNYGIAPLDAFEKKPEIEER
jgi:hypothetical protein